MKTVFLFLSKEIYALDLLRGDYAKYLSDRYRVVAFVRSELLESDKGFLKSPRIIYIPWRVQNARFWDMAKRVRALLVRQFDRLRVQRFKKEKAATTLPRKIIMKLAAWAGPLTSVDAIFFLERLLLPRASYAAFRRYAEEYQPAAILTATPGISNLDAEAIAFGRKAGIPTAAIDASWDNLTTKTKVFRRPDYFIVWNGIIQDELVRLYQHPAERIFVSGMMRLDPYFRKYPDFISRDAFLKSKGLNPKYKTIFFSTTSHGVYPHHDEVLRLLLRARKEKRIEYVNLFVRLHYKDSIERYREFLQEPDLHVEEFAPKNPEADLLNLKASFLYSDVNVNYTSTLSIDGVVLDRPVINIAWPDQPTLKHYTYEHYQPIVRSGAVRMAYTEAECLDYIAMYLKNPAIDADKRAALSSVFMPVKDGMSYKRHVDFLDTIVK